MKIAYLLLLCFILLGIWCIFLIEIFKRKIHIWLPKYISREIIKKIRPQSLRGPVHILFCIVDHFEPGWNKADLHKERERVDGWMNGYPKMAKNFIDSDGYSPRHTWFYPPHYFREEHILKILSLCKKGFGEIEMHLHHSRMDPFPDTSETLKTKILKCIDTYSQYGIFCTSIGGNLVKKFAFIHGDWALDNSRKEYCGVNDEIRILKETGCYADFTFPSYMIKSQPKMVNSIYYAVDDPYRAKSYDKGQIVISGRKYEGDLMIIQGPLGFRWKGRKHWIIPSIEDGEISSKNIPNKDRVDYWVNIGIHLSGNRNWLIVKVFTHGAPVSEHEVLLGKTMISMHNYLQKRYNDGNNYVLHYVTARELYNIIKASEMGFCDNPGKYRNFLIKKYAY